MMPRFFFSKVLEHHPLQNSDYGKICSADLEHRVAKSPIGHAAACMDPVQWTLKRCNNLAEKYPMLSRIAIWSPKLPWNTLIVAD